MDAGREWVEAHAEAHPALKEALADGGVAKRARATTYLWRRATDARVRDLRTSDGIRIMMNKSHVHRVAIRMTSSFINKHSTFATFLSEPLDGLQRWQSACACACMRVHNICARLTCERAPRCAAVFMILITLVINALLVNIWVRTRRGACVGRAV